LVVENDFQLIMQHAGLQN